MRIGHSLDLLLKVMEERKLGLAVISEFYLPVPTDHRWLGSIDESPTVAITWQSAVDGQVCEPLEQGFAVVR